MVKDAKKEYLEQIRERYRRASREYKKRILDEFCEVCGYHRKHAIRLLNQDRRRRKKKPGREPAYGAGERKVLKNIWLNADRPCSKRLKAILPTWLQFYEKEHGNLAVQVRLKLARISARSIDRLLRPVRQRYGSHGLCGTKPGTLLKNLIPIKTSHWDVTKPGFVEADTVAHCGGSLEGNFVWSLTFTDVFSGWTENRAVWNKGAYGVHKQIEDIEGNLPFRILGFHCDNGSEFLTHHLYSYFTERKAPVAFTRSRPNKKNDNAHVEQKNWTHVRLLLGYQRIENPELVAKINHLYQAWNMFNNFFCANLKLLEKQRVNSRYKKNYDHGATPYQRLMASDQINEAQKTHITELMCNLNPYALRRQIDYHQRQILSALR
jgi:hypothetical protein